jgi:uncharacterized protein
MDPGVGAFVQVKSLTNQALIADKCYVAECFLDRLRGLIGKPKLGPGEGMLLRPCNSIHMWFMNYPLDVVFIRRQVRANGEQVTKVTSVYEGIRAWRPHPLTDWRASETLELPVGTIRRCAIHAGDELCIS